MPAATKVQHPPAPVHETTRLGPTARHTTPPVPPVQSKTPLKEEVEEGKGHEPLCVPPTLLSSFVLPFFSEGRFWVYVFVFGGRVCEGCFGA